MLRVNIKDPYYPIIKPILPSSSLPQFVEHCLDLIRQGNPEERLEAANVLKFFHELIPSVRRSEYVDFLVLQLKEERKLFYSGPAQALSQLRTWISFEQGKEIIALCLARIEKGISSASRFLVHFKEFLKPDDYQKIRDLLKQFPDKPKNKLAHAIYPVLSRILPQSEVDASHQKKRRAHELAYFEATGEDLLRLGRGQWFSDKNEEAHTRLALATHLELFHFFFDSEQKHRLFAIPLNFLGQLRANQPSRPTQNQLLDLLQLLILKNFYPKDKDCAKTREFFSGKAGINDIHGMILSILTFLESYLSREEMQSNPEIRETFLVHLAYHPRLDVPDLKLRILELLVQSLTWGPSHLATFAASSLQSWIPILSFEERGLFIHKILVNPRNAEHQVLALYAIRVQQQAYLEECPQIPMPAKLDATPEAHHQATRLQTWFRGQQAKKALQNLKEEKQEGLARWQTYQDFKTRVNQALPQLQQALNRDDMAALSQSFSSFFSETRGYTIKPALSEIDQKRFGLTGYRHLKS